MKDNLITALIILVGLLVLIGTTVIAVSILHTSYVSTVISEGK